MLIKKFKSLHDGYQLIVAQSPVKHERDSNIKTHKILALDDSPKLTVEEKTIFIEKYHPNIPIHSINNNEDKKVEFENGCAKYPKLYDMKFSNKYWQVITFVS